jgi:hypothetical protein
VIQQISTVRRLIPHFRSLITVLVLFSSTQVHGEIPLIDRDNGSLWLGGYFSSLSGVQHFPYETMGFIEETSGLNASMFRLGLRGEWRGRAVLEIEDRLFWFLQADSGVNGGSAQMGLSSTQRPGRTFDLSYLLLDQDSFYLEQDVERFSLSLFLDRVDLVIGRQPITWGEGLLFPSTDLWVQYSPFELDTSLKPGVDAIRLMMAPLDNLELDVVLVDRGALEDLSSGAQLKGYLAWGNLYGGVAKSWNRLFITGGTSAEVRQFMIRFEGVLPFEYEESRLGLPSLTGGIDWFSGDAMVSVEYHYNGSGALGPEGYMGQAQDERTLRGEYYLLGRHYLGALINYRPHELLGLQWVSMFNPVDQSALFTTGITYDFVQDIQLGLGQMWTLGSDPDRLTLQPTSEFGIYPHLFYLLFSGYI